MISTLAYIVFELGLLALCFGWSMRVWRNGKLSLLARSGRSLRVWLVAVALQSTLPVIPALFFYAGRCYGFTDGEWSCTFVEFAANNFSLNLALSFFWFLVMAILVLGGALVGLVARHSADQ